MILGAIKLADRFTLMRDKTYYMFYRVTPDVWYWKNSNGEEGRLPWTASDIACLIKNDGFIMKDNRINRMCEV